MNKKYIKILPLWFKAFLPSLIWAAVIFIFSSQTSLPSLNYSWGDFVFKKAAHMFVYAVLFFLLHRGFSNVLPPKHPLQSKVWQLAIFLSFVYAISDEYHQSFVPGRYGTVRDLGYDMLGVGIAFLKRYKYV